MNTIISVSETAKQKLIEYAQTQGVKSLVLHMKPSGCSGWRYQLLKEPIRDTDMLSETISEDLSIRFEAEQLQGMTGTFIDYEQKGLNSQFVFRNTQATAYCGCGESFQR